MQAAYCVGGHWFNASVIESCILKGKAMAHRPQFVSLTPNFVLGLSVFVCTFTYHDAGIHFQSL